MNQLCPRLSEKLILSFIVTNSKYCALEGASCNTGNKINYATSIWTQKKEEIFWKQNIEGTTRGTQYRFASWKVRSPNHSLASCRKELLGWASVAWGCLSSKDHSFLPSQSMWFASTLLSHPVKDEQVSKANTKEHQLLAIEVDG